jgi:hypothetical protein
MGPATSQRDDAVEALRFAVEMFGKGHADVVIVDLARDGKAYAPTDFAKFYYDVRK